MFRRQNSTKYYQDGLTKEWFGDHKEAFKLFLKVVQTCKILSVSS